MTDAASGVMWWLAAWLACAEEPVVVAPPDTHTWADEAQLVVAGLHDVETLWEAGQKSAAKTLAERVYTDRFEPRLEPALREMEGAKSAAIMELSFGHLQLALGGKDRGKVADRVESIERRVRVVAEAAARAFPPPGQPALPPPPPKDVRPLVPDVPANWELGETTEQTEDTPTDK